MGTIQKISMVGAGNVGSNLLTHLRSAGIDVTHIHSRTPSNIPQELVNDSLIVSDLSDLPREQLVLLCVPDDKIIEVANSIDNSCPIAYTSGSVNLKELGNHQNIGVFYPLQTFSKGKRMDLSEVPFFIEANSEVYAQQLYSLASVISKNVSFASSEKRKKLHLAAVWVNNFTNHIVHIAQSYSEKNDLNFDHLKPLLRETIDKLSTMDAFNAQTGPARRADLAIIKQHSEGLTGTEKELYDLISKNIYSTYYPNEKL